MRRFTNFTMNIIKTYVLRVEVQSPTAVVIATSVVAETINRLRSDDNDKDCSCKHTTSNMHPTNQETT